MAQTRGKDITKAIVKVSREEHPLSVGGKASPPPPTPNPSISLDDLLLA